MTYQLGFNPRVEVLSPKLELAEGKKEIPHMYNQKRLCLHYPKYREWTPKKLLSKTIIPWISDWLYHYESWLATGEWLGGGIEHAPLPIVARIDESIESNHITKH
jgi:hypothetical protein